MLHRLVETADVFLTNFLPAARRRLRIDVDDIRRINPRVIYVRGHGQGNRGPDRERGGYDAASFWCRGGIANALTPPTATAPVMQRAAFGDSTGAMTIAGGIAAALFRRERTGQPAVVDISLLGTAMWVLAPDIVASKLLGVDLPASDRTRAPNPIVNSYRTRDGRWLFLNMLQPDRYWSDLCTRLGHPELIADPRFADGRVRFENRVDCIKTLDRIFAERTLSDVRGRERSVARRAEELGRHREAGQPAVAATVRGFGHEGHAGNRSEAAPVTAPGPVRPSPEPDKPTPQGDPTEPAEPSSPENRPVPDPEPKRA